jgi:hypothetical protein
MNNQPVRNLKMHDGLHEMVDFIKIVDLIDLQKYGRAEDWGQVL